jgi:hypothetical protein
MSVLGNGLGKLFEIFLLVAIACAPALANGPEREFREAAGRIQRLRGGDAMIAPEKTLAFMMVIGHALFGNAVAQMSGIYANSKNQTLTHELRQNMRTDATPIRVMTCNASIQSLGLGCEHNVRAQRLRDWLITHKDHVDVLIINEMFTETEQNDFRRWVKHDPGSPFYRADGSPACTKVINQWYDGAWSSFGPLNVERER